MENPFCLKTSQGHSVYGVHHRNEKYNTKGCVVLVHGLTGGMNQYLHLTFARYCSEQGIDILRFNQYDDRERARRFHETTISGHVQDTEEIVSYGRSVGYEKFILVGHSLGGPVAISAVAADTAGLLLWDPTSTPSERVSSWDTRHPVYPLSYLELQTRVFLSDEWINDAKQFPNSYHLLSQISVPLCIIGAQLGEKLDFCERYRTSYARPHTYLEILGAGHQFNEEGAIEQLCNESFRWMKQLLKSTNEA